ncbi:MAG: glycosyltransferase family 2 protein [Ilumatobacteraceae bacterium]
MKAEPRVLVVVPAWNEERTVGAVVTDLRDLGLDVVVVDDGSSDRTSPVASAHGAMVVRLPVNLGVGAAMRCGFRFAVEHGYDAVVQCDADGQHSVAGVASLVAVQAASGAHMVIGSRFGGGDDYPVGSLRRVAMRMLARSASRATGSRITDATSGFRIIVEPLLGAFAATFPDNYLGDTYEAVVSAGRAGYSIAETPVPMRQRQHGESSASPLAAVRFMVRAVIVVAARLNFQVTPPVGA